MPLCGGGVLQSLAKPCPASAGDDLRAKSRHFVPVALRNVACGRQCWHRPGKPCDAANPKRRAKTPALHCGREWVAMHKRQPSTRPVGGPMRSSAPAQALRPAGGSAASPFQPSVCPTLRPGKGNFAQTVANHQTRRRANENHRPLRRGDFAVPGSAVRLPCIAGRAFTPAGGPCVSPEGYW